MDGQIASHFETIEVGRLERTLATVGIGQCAFQQHLNQAATALAHLAGAVARKLTAKTCALRVGLTTERGMPDGQSDYDGGQP